MSLGQMQLICIISNVCALVMVELIALTSES